MVIALTLAAALWTAPAAIARMSFDGRWSVLIVTDAGTCDRAYRYALNIVNGRITYDDPSFNISGHVDARGHVRVSVSAGGERASGTGELSGDSGRRPVDGTFLDVGMLRPLGSRAPRLSAAVTNQPQCRRCARNGSAKNVRAAASAGAR